MMLEHLCKCNNCGNILYDENPQVGAEKYNIEEQNEILKNGNTKRIYFK